MAEWMSEAERVSEGDYIGECDNGDLWVWSRRAGRWVLLSRWKPTHRLAYWRSRRAHRVVWLEVSR